MSISVFRTQQEFLDWRNHQTLPIGFVPTMGNLHLGHLSLMEKSLQDFPLTVLSIFVNPTQFGPNEDYLQYPRTLDQDLEMCRKLLSQYPLKKLAIFAPCSPDEVYGENFQTFIQVRHLSPILEGQFRQRHFEGVATVVYLLFQLVKPEVAYFGQKDFQQSLVIKKMVQDLRLPVQIQVLPTQRDPSGLALSSRNNYLSLQEKQQALCLIRSLQKIEQIIDGKFIHLPKAKQWIDEQLQKDPCWQYLTIRDAKTLDEVTHYVPKIVILGVYLIGKVRLLDNLEVTLTP